VDRAQCEGDFELNGYINRSHCRGHSSGGRTRAQRSAGSDPTSVCCHCGKSPPFFGFPMSLLFLLTSTFGRSSRNPCHKLASLGRVIELFVVVILWVAASLL